MAASSFRFVWTHIAAGSFSVGVDALLLTGRLWVEWVVSGAYFGPTGSDGVGRFARPCFRGEKGVLMAVESVNYQCPACGGPLHFSESKGLMVCDYCESSFEVAQIEAHYAAKQSKADASAVAAAERAASGEMSAFEAMGATDGVAVALTEDVLNAAAATSGHACEGDEAIASFLSRASWNEGERDGLRSMTCSSCGAEITCDATTAVSECPYCGNPAVTPGAFVDMARPDGVVPFKLDKDAAVAALNDYYKVKGSCQRNLSPRTKSSISRAYMCRSGFTMVRLKEAARLSAATSAPIARVMRK